MRSITNQETMDVSGGAILNPNGRPTKIIQILVPVYDEMGNVIYSNVNYQEVFDTDLEAARETAKEAARVAKIYADEFKKAMPACEHTINTSGDSSTKTYGGTVAASPSGTYGGSATAQKPGVNTKCPIGG